MRNGRHTFLCSTFPTALLTAAGPVRASVFSEPSSSTWHAAPVASRARAAALGVPSDHGSLVQQYRSCITKNSIVLLKIWVPQSHGLITRLPMRICVKKHLAAKPYYTNTEKLVSFEGSWTHGENDY